MQKAVRFKTEMGNRYMHSPKINQILLVHPAINRLLELREQRIDLQQWARSQETGSDGKIFLDENESVSPEELERYVEKIRLWEQNGYLEPLDTKEVLSGRITADSVKGKLANCGQITFEVTEACNLNCAYCAFGKFYNDYGHRESRYMSFEQAKALMDYMVEYWNSNMNMSHHRAINIAFYGGEPLLNFQLIQRVVEYSQTLPLKHNYFTYSMTTNGLLLDRYMDYLKEHGFRLLISLDGNREENGYRVLHNGGSSHARITKNVENLRSAHPDYFQKYVDFITVLHNKNSVSKSLNYFKKKYQKNVSIVELSPFGIAPELEEEFWNTYKNFQESLDQAPDSCELRRDYLMKLPEGHDTSLFITEYSGYVFDSYNAMAAREKVGKFVPTGTCPPFGKKVFMTVDGNIKPCERIDAKFVLGTVSGEGNEYRINLDHGKIADMYNGYFDKLSRLCGMCYRNHNCNQCVFYLDLEKKNVSCPGCIDNKGFAELMGQRMSNLEANPNLYNIFMKEVTFG
jgi:uncharacterized protein